MNGDGAYQFEMNEVALFQNAQFLEARWKIECNKVLIDHSIELHFDLKPDWDVSVSMSEILRSHQLIYPIDPSGYHLKDSKRTADS